jgi:hypothetical protein
MNQLHYFGLFILIILYMLSYKITFASDLNFWKTFRIDMESFTESQSPPPSPQSQSPPPSPSPSELQKQKDISEVKNIIDAKLSDPCGNAKFYTDTGKSGNLSFCSDSIFATGCTETTKNRDKLYDAFSVFGTYINEIDDNNIQKCMQSHGKTLSDWGLCDVGERDKIKKELANPENEHLFQEISNACNFYKDGNGNNRAVLQINSPSKTTMKL